MISRFEMIIFAYVTPGNNLRPLSLFNFEPSESRDSSFEYDLPSNKEYYLQPGTTKALNNCQKPVALLTDIIKHFSRPGAWVLDLCCGVGK